jgi:hypothetical protein
MAAARRACGSQEVSMGARSLATTLLLAGICGVASAQAPAPAPEAAAAQPSFRVEQANLDLGTVRAGEDAVATFVFRNDGQAPVKILSAKPG